jgi:ribosomal 50S subunit-recycling heat shock protein
MRLDKFLKVSRILKRRSVANEACSGGKVEVNGKVAKPSVRLKVGDVVCVSYSTGNFVFKVVMLNENAKKEDADKMYEIISG